MIPKRTNQRPAIGDEEATAIEVREHPLVRIETVAIRQFQAVQQGAELRTNGRRAGQGRIDMQPDIVPATDLADAPQRIEAQRRRRPGRRAGEEGPAARGNVGGDCLGEAVGPHRPLIVDLNAAKGAAPSPATRSPFSTEECVCVEA